MPFDKEIAALKRSLKPKDAADQLNEIIHSTRFTALFTKKEYEAASAVLWELTMLRRFKRIALKYTQAFSEEMEKI